MRMAIEKVATNFCLSLARLLDTMVEHIPFILFHFISFYVLSNHLGDDKGYATLQLQDAFHYCIVANISCTFLCECLFLFFAWKKFDTFG